MNVTRAELIQSLQNVKTSLRPDESSFMEAQDVADKLRSTVPKSDTGKKIASRIKNQYNEALTEGANIEKEWRPQKSSIRNIMDKVLVEAAQQPQNSPNAMRLNLQSMVVDKMHAKFSVTRNGVEAIVELLYPNVNEKITVKVSVKGADDNLEEVGLEDQPYLTDFGAYILKLIDDTIANSAQSSGSVDGTQMNLGNASAGGSGLTGNTPSWEQGGESAGTNMWESDNSRIASLMTLVEQEEEEEDFDVDFGGVDDALAGAEGGGLDVGGDAGFGEDDFAIDAGAETDTGDFTADFGGDFGGGDFGDEGGGDINAADDGMMGGEGEPDAEWSTFRDKSDWLQSSLDTMQELTSSSVAQKMQQGTGVVLTSDEILNGSVGLRNDMPVDVIDKFLNVYPELDNIELKESDLEQIEEKLSLDDGQFDAWLQQSLPSFTGQDEVSSTLDNDMFEDFDAMGGEPVGDDMMSADPMGGDEFMDEDAEREAGATPDASFETFLDDLNPDEETSADEMEAESQVDLEELPELPNL